VVEGTQDSTSASCDRDRCLRYRAPEHRAVAEKDAGPALFQRLQPIRRSQHRLAIIHSAWQAALAEGLTEIAGIGGEYDLSAIQPQPKGLMPRRAPVRGQAHPRSAGFQGRRGRAQSSRALVFAFGLTCPINPEFSRTSGGARAPGSYRTSSEASVGEQLCLAGAGVHLPYHVFISQAGIL